MRRHELDPISLVTGLVFVAIATVYLVGQYTDLDVSAGWVLPLGLIGLGLAGLTGSVRRGLRADQPVAADPAHEDAPEGYGRLDRHSDGGLDEHGSSSTGADSVDR